MRTKKQYSHKKHTKHTKKRFGGVSAAASEGRQLTNAIVDEPYFNQNVTTVKSLTLQVQQRNLSNSFQIQKCGTIYVIELQNLPFITKNASLMNLWINHYIVLENVLTTLTKLEVCVIF